MKPTVWKITLWVMLLMTFSMSGQEDSTSRDTSSRVRKLFVLYDTVRVQYTTRGSEQLIGLDSSLNKFHHYNPARQGEYDLATLGNVGSPHTQLIWQPTLYQGFRVGLDYFDAYRMKTDSLRFFKSEFPVTELTYTQISQANNQVSAYFGMETSPRWAFTINYNYAGQKGLYTYQTTRSQNIGLGVRYTGKNKRYTSWMTYILNSLKAQENGGFNNPEPFSDNQYYLFPANITTRINTGLHRHYHNDFSYLQHFRLTRDSTAFYSKGYFVHELSIKGDVYKYSDQTTTVDSSYLAYYGDFMVNPRGLRHFIKTNTYGNRLAYHQKIKSFDAEAGLVYDFIHVYQQPLSENYNNFKLYSKITIASKSFDANLYAHFHVLGRNVGDYALKGNIKGKFGQWGEIEGFIFNQLYEPSLSETQLYISDENIYTNSFKKVKQLTIGGNLGIPKLGFKVSVQSHTLGSYIYFDTDALPKQATTTAAILQLAIHENFKLWKFYSENQIVYQVENAPYLRLPSLVFKNGLYFRSPILRKRMVLNVGADLRWQSSVVGYAWFPIPGQFYLQNDITSTPYPWLDLGASVKVKTFRFFVIGENLLLDVTRRSWSQVAGYVYPFRQIRFGISWRMSD